jgi:myxalamid-type polyketide synthase MxaB
MSSKRGADQPSQRDVLSERTLLALKQAKTRIEVLEKERSEAIAIIGVGCRYSGGADSPSSFWKLLAEGRDGITEVPPERWDIDTYYDPTPGAAGKICTRRGGFVDNVDGFDAWFFGISPREAAGMDPQQRLFLEVAWEALESAGHPAEKVYGSQTGVFAGICSYDYAGLKFAAQNRQAIDAYFATGNAICAVAGRCSYVLGLKGPSLSVDTACSSSLVAVHSACQSLRSKDCNLALAGGVNLLLAPELSISFSKAGMLAPDGRCKTFDASADGYVRGDGCGVLVLKRLADAEADGDRILALIRGSAVSQDGPSGGLTVPSGPAQEAVIERALAVAGLAPSDVAYVEAHGTGTSLGDPIEVNALAAALGRGRSPEEPLLLGSVKTNIGHTEGAAGVAGIIKVVLSLVNDQIPPHLNFQEPNPHVDWSQIPVRVATELQAWPDDRPRIAGVSSFGATGTNAHVVLAEPPRRSPSTPGAKPERSYHLLPLSAKTEAGLVELAGRYADHLRSDTGLDLAAICHGAGSGRNHFSHRLALTGAGPAEIADKLAQLHDQPQPVNGGTGDDSAGLRLACLFTGQGSQHPGMGRSLYRTEPVFRDALDRCQELVGSSLDRSLVSLVCDDNLADDLLNQTLYTQPALFAFEYALFQLWHSWGLRPAAVLGHSVGEYVAACVAGVFSLADGLKLISNRARLMQELPGGSMAALFCDEQQAVSAIAPFNGALAIAGINGPKLVVVSGETPLVDQLLADLDRQGIGYQPLNVSHAFHSPMMDGMLDQYRRGTDEVSFAPPQISLISNLSGKPIDSLPSWPAYWVEHVRRGVRFADGMRSLQQAGINVFLEIGPRPTLVNMGQRCLPDDDSALWLTSTRPGRDHQLHLLETIGQLYERGAEVDWAVMAGGRHEMVELPTYPFQRRRFWFTDDQEASTRPAILRAKLPGRRLQLPFSHEVRYESSFSQAYPPYIDDHKLFGTIVVAGASHISTLLLAAKETLGGSRWMLTDLMMQQPMMIAEGGELQVQVVLRQESAGHELQLISAAPDSRQDAGWTRHVSGRLAASAAEDGAEIEQEAGRLKQIAATKVGLPGSELYDRVAGFGHHLGSSFRWVENVWQSGREMVSEMTAPELPVDSAVELDDYLLFPGLIDSCIQPFCILGPDAVNQGDQPNDGSAYIPFSIHRLICHSSYNGSTGHPRGKLWCYTRLREHDPGTSLTGDILLLDDQHRPLLEIRGFTARRLAPEALSRAAAEAGNTARSWFYSVDWQQRKRTTQEQSEANAGAAYIILADRGGVGEKLAAELTARGQRCVAVSRGNRYSSDGMGGYLADPLAANDMVHLLEAESASGICPGVIHLWSLDTSPANPDEAQTLVVESPLLTLQALSKVYDGQPSRPQLWLISQGAHSVGGDTAPINLQQTPLWGLGKVVAIEHPELRCSRIDIACDPDDSDIASLCDELLQPDQEDQVVLRRQARWVPRLVEIQPPGRQLAAATGDHPLPHTETGSPVKVKISEYGVLDNLCLVPMERRPPATGEVEIAVRATGLNFRDVLRALGMLVEHEADLGYSASADMTFGFECSGVVVSVGDGVTDFSCGDQVVAALTFAGSLSSYITVDTGFVFHKPEQLSHAEAATLPLAYLTAYYGLRHLSPLKPGEKVLIHAAAGGVGVAAVQLALASGAEVFATASPGKWDFLRSLGVKHLMSSRTTDFAGEIMNLTNGEGVDVVLNSLTGELIDKSFEVLSPGGRFIEIGKIGIWTEEQARELRADVSYHPFDLWNVSGQDPDLIRQMFAELVSDLDAGRVAPLHHQVFPVDETEKAFRHMAQAKHIGKIVIAQPEPARVPASHQGPSLVRGDASYLVTGGLGALGLEVAEWLAEQGAGHLVLMARSQAGAKAEKVIARIRERGVTVTVTRGDVARAIDVEQVFAGIADQMPPLRGIIHAAGTIDDRMLVQQTSDSFRQVMAPKLKGAWNLHQLSQGMQLDHFVLFSSAASMLGSAGQGNYAAANAFLDGLASFRRASGQPGLSICWGPWDGAGMAARLDQRMRERLQAQGIETIPTEQGLQALEQLLTADRTQVGVLPIDWRRYTEQVYRGAPPMLFQELVPDTERPVAEQPMTSRFAEELSAAAAADRRRLLATHIRAQIATVMGLASGRDIEMRHRLFDIGIDSLMAVELTNLLGASLGLTLPSTLVFDYPTLEAMVDYLAERLDLHGDDQPPEHQADQLDLTGLEEDELAALLEQEVSAGRLEGAP